MPNFPVTASDTGLTLSDSVAAKFATTVTDTALALTTAAPQRLVGRAQPTTTGLTVTDTVKLLHALALADTSLAVTDSLARYHPIALSSNAFPSFAPDSGILDNFNRANENPLSQGGNWTNLGGQRLALVSNAVVGTSAGNRCAMSYSGAGDFTDCDAWVTLTGSPSIPNDQFLYSGVFARQAHTGFVIATGQRCYQVLSDPGVNEIILMYVNVGGGESTLGSWPITTRVGDSLGIRCVGSTISAYYKPVGGDWTLLGSVTDTSEPSGYVGLLSSDTTFSMDNFGAGVPSVARPFDSIQPNHYTVALSDSVFMQPFAGGTGVLDDFLRPNESPLSGGGRWARQGTFGANLNLVSHSTVAGTVSQLDSESYVAAGSLNDCEVWATLSTLPWSGNFDSAGVILRQNPATDSQKDCYALAYEADGSTLFLTYTDASGTGTSLGSWPLVLSNGDSIGLRAVGTTFTVYYRHGAGAWQVAGVVTDSHGSHGYLGLQQLSQSGVPSAITNFGGGAIGVHDSIVPVLAPQGLFPDTGVTITDSILSRLAANRNVSVTALAITDAMVVFLNGNASVSLTDIGLVVSDLPHKSAAKFIADTGLTVSTDSIAVTPTRRHLLTDTGLTVTDTITKTVHKTISDTGLTVTDTPHRSYPVAITTTGLTVTDTTAKTARKAVSDTGLSLTDAMVVRKNGGNTSVSLTDRGVSVTTTLAKAAVYFRAVPGPVSYPDHGCTINDGIRVTRSPPQPPPTKPQANFTFSVAGETVTFTDTSTPGGAPIGSWAWSFGDSNTSSATNPVHTYAAADTYNVTLTVTTIYGHSSITKPVTTSDVSPTFGTHIEAVIF